MARKETYLSRQTKRLSKGQCLKSIRQLTEMKNLLEKAAEVQPASQLIQESAASVNEIVQGEIDVI